MVKTYTDIKEMMSVTTEIERVLGDLGETPYDPFREEKDEDTTGESSIDKQLSVSNETLIHFFKDFGSRNGASVNFSGSTSRCQLCQVDDYIVVACPEHNDMWPKCSKCGGHRVENYGIKCSFCNGLGHSKDRYWKKKNIKPSNYTTNYLKVLVNDEEATLTELNMICGAIHHLSSRNRIPKRRLSM
jgi:hypothetical protein